jgi:lipoprotein-anchoring transpeptidase ErfK/SrfK
VLLAAVTASIAVLVLSGCSKKAQPGPVPAGATSAISASGGDASPSKTEAPAAVVTVTPAEGAAGVNPLAPIRVAASGGTLSTVSLANAAGTVVKGAIAADRKSWSTAEPLGYDKTYTVTASAVNAEGKETKHTSTFTTVKPNNLTMPYIQTAAGGGIDPGVTFGIGQVVRIHFDESIPDRKTAQAAISITTVPAQPGAFNWMSDQDVYWRTKDYLKPGTKVTINVKAYGKNFGSALFGQADASTWFKVGAKHVSIADDNDKLVKVYENDVLVRTMPTSMGRDARIKGDDGSLIDLRTNSGPHVVVGGETNINMNSASFGLSKGANAYKTIVPVGVRISYDGEYVHWADWSIGAQGNTDTSHGCLNISPDNAWWFYNFSVPGDIVDVRNTGRPLDVGNSGYWVDSWAQWTAGSAR